VCDINKIYFVVILPQNVSGTHEKVSVKWVAKAWLHGGLRL